jgi:hypothetical protein
MGNDAAPMTRAHFTPILFTKGPPKKQTDSYVSFEVAEKQVMALEELTQCKECVSQSVAAKCVSEAHLPSIKYQLIRHTKYWKSQELQDHHRQDLRNH